MPGLELLVGWLIALVIGMVLIVHVSNKLTSGDDFTFVEKLIALYVGVAVLTWMSEGYGGTPPLQAIVPALSWPLRLANWVQGQLKS